MQEIEEVSGTDSFLPPSPGVAVAVDGLAAQRVALARALWPGRQLKALDAMHISAEEATPTTLAYPVRYLRPHCSQLQ